MRAAATPYPLGRRQFLRLGAGAFALATFRLKPARAAPSGRSSRGLPAASYDAWPGLYRERLRWDRRVRCTHVVNCWYQRNCCWDVFVKDGVILREEQAGAYPAVAPDVPDFNPRGCQKGACYSELIYAPDRLQHPLLRAGPRGSGRWRRASWQEALERVADGLIDALGGPGPESIVLDPGGSLASASFRVGQYRLLSLLDGIELDTNTELDDGQGGASISFGTPVASRSADDLVRSDLILIWGANPVYTQIPNAHFINEARYKGAKVVTIAPDYSPSSIHADLYVPVRPGGDAALALSLAREMLARGRIDEDFVRAQTDLPYLLTEHGRFLREADLTRGGARDVFYVLDERTGRPAPAPHHTLEWGDVRPALSGHFEIESPTGPLHVRPVLDLLRERLDRDYGFEQAASLSGVPAATIAHLADLVCGARAMAGIAGSSLPKLYHGDLIMRAQILLFVLGGHFGRPGAGFDTCPMLRVDGIDQAGQSQAEAIGQKLRMAPSFLRGRLSGKTSEQLLSDLLRDYKERAPVHSSVLYWRHHAHMQARTDADWGRQLARPLSAYLQESFDAGWQKPPPATPPRVLFLAGSNLLRRFRSSDLLLENVWPKLDLVVATELRMSTTCLHADVLLPGAASYEKDDVSNWFTLLSPFMHVTQAAVPPPGDARPEWEIFSRMAAAIEKRARERGIRHFHDRSGEERSFEGFAEHFGFDGRFGPEDQTRLVGDIVSKTSFVDRDFETLREPGFQRVTGIGGHPVNLGNATSVRPDAPVINREWRRTKPGPWPTFTGRIQLYIDHPLYLELGEELPTHKQPPAAGGAYPLVLSSGHTRWSIHAGWRNVLSLLRLQRGEAVAFVSPSDARPRGIRDGDRVRLFNDIGAFRVQAKLAPALRPGMLILYHAFEDYQFPDGRGYRQLIPSPINPAELAGGYTHLRPAPATLQPGQSDRETRVDLARA